MKKLTLSLAGLIVSATLVAAADAPAKKPNVVVILCDDMGFSDLGCYSGEIATPNLDALAANGLRFTQFYNCARCCPTRASLLTGLYPHQAGVGHMTEDLGKPGYAGQLNATCRTIPEVLKPAGYRNYMVGKWHVTRAVGKDGPKTNWPLHRGFDRYYGTLQGAGSYYDPCSLTRDDTTISPYADPEYKPATYYYTDALADHAVRFVGEHARDHATKPFFLYVAFTAAHWPMHALPEDIAKYKGKYDTGYDPVRRARFEKSVKLGLVDPRQPMAPNPVDWATVPDKPWEVACMEVYAAMVDRMDQGVGKLVAELKRTGQLDNTLILFLQDNGGCAEATGRTGNKQHPNIDRPAKPTFPTRGPEFLVTGITPTQTRDGYPLRMGPKAFPGPADTYVAYGRGWATVSNTPFREYKHWVHEGGIGTPLVAHWPAGIPARGELRSQPGHLVDVAPTIYALAGAEYPKELLTARPGLTPDRPVGRLDQVPPLEGTSLLPAFAGQPLTRDALYWEHEGNRAVRAGDWKLVAKHDKPWELYDLAHDRVESADLAAKHADKVKALADKYAAYAKRTGVEPWPVAAKK